MNRFTKGSGKYTCQSCGKLTRDTGEGEAEVGLCAYCNACAEWYNSYQDHVITKEEYDAKVLELRKEYKHPGHSSDEYGE